MQTDGRTRSPQGGSETLRRELDLPSDHRPISAVRARDPVRAGRVDSAATPDTLLKSSRPEQFYRPNTCRQGRQVEL